MTYRENMNCIFPTNNEMVPITIDFCYEIEVNLQSLFDKVTCVDMLKGGMRTATSWELELITLKGLLDEFRNKYEESKVND
jgi:hypothetical protein